MYIPNFEMVYLAIYKYFLFKKKLHVVDYFVLYNFCVKVFHFAHLISWRSHYSRMK
jgi:hypothetical protein